MCGDFSKSWLWLRGRRLAGDPVVAQAASQARSCNCISSLDASPPPRLATHHQHEHSKLLQDVCRLDQDVERPGRRQAPRRDPLLPLLSAGNPAWTWQRHPADTLQEKCPLHRAGHLQHLHLSIFNEGQTRYSRTRFKLFRFLYMFPVSSVFLVYYQDPRQMIKYVVGHGNNSQPHNKDNLINMRSGSVGPDCWLCVLGEVWKAEVLAGARTILDWSVAPYELHNIKEYLQPIITNGYKKVEQSLLTRNCDDHLLSVRQQSAGRHRQHWRHWLHHQLQPHWERHQLINLRPGWGNWKSMMTNFLTLSYSNIKCERKFLGHWPLE